MILQKVEKKNKLLSQNVKKDYLLQIISMIHRRSKEKERKIS